MRLFITGGTGFVGSNFLNEAHRRGHDILAFVVAPTANLALSWIILRSGVIDRWSNSMEATSPQSMP